LVIALAGLPHMAAAHGPTPAGVHASQAAQHHPGTGRAEHKGAQSQAEDCSGVLACYACLSPPAVALAEMILRASATAHFQMIRLDPAPDRLLRPPRLSPSI